MSENIDLLRSCYTSEVRSAPEIVRIGFAVLVSAEFGSTKESNIAAAISLTVAPNNKGILLKLLKGCIKN